MHLHQSKFLRVFCPQVCWYAILLSRGQMEGLMGGRVKNIRWRKNIPIRVKRFATQICKCIYTKANSFGFFVPRSVGTLFSLYLSLSCCLAISICLIPRQTAEIMKCAKSRLRFLHFFNECDCKFKLGVIFINNLN